MRLASMLLPLLLTMGCGNNNDDREPNDPFKERPEDWESDTDTDADSDADSDSDSDTDTDTDPTDAALLFSPDPVDFDELSTGCSDTKKVSVTNVSDETLSLTDIHFTGDSALSLDEDFELPVYLVSGAKTDLTLSYHPQSAGAFGGNLEVVTYELEGSATVAVSGSAVGGATYEDSWEIGTDTPADVLFSIDTSCSMEDDQAALGGAYADFVAALEVYAEDWQIMVANGDDGCNDSGILTPTTPKADQDFAYAVDTPGGTYTEALLTVASRAISESGTSGCNAGFLRLEAMLHIVLISDEPEQSFSAWADNVADIQALKGDASLVRISAIAGPVPGGCGSADPGTGYADAATATGGAFLSICSDWTGPAALDALAEATINREYFVLSQPAAAASIQVEINGSTTSSWTFDAAANAVTLTKNLPALGDTVSITYAGQGACD